jgi:hypothetical protein
LISEEEIFTGYESSSYLMALYNIVTSFRYYRQPYCEIRVITDGDPESEAILKSMLIVDNMNPSYPMDFQKFLGTATGSGGAIGPGVGGGAPTAYY